MDTTFLKPTTIEIANQNKSRMNSTPDDSLPMKNQVYGILP